MFAHNGHAESAEQRLAPLDSAAAHVAALTENPNFRRDSLFGATRNLVSMADRWATVRPLLEQLVNASAASPVALPLESSSALAVGSKPISKVTLGASRYSGFTQSETSTTWCGSSVVVGFNDTGSFIRTILGNGGISVLGYSNSTNRGTAFTYVGSPPATASANQSILGEPSLVCADSDNIYYASIWSDSVQSRSGVTIANLPTAARLSAPP